MAIATWKVLCVWICGTYVLHIDVCWLPRGRIALCLILLLARLDVGGVGSFTGLIGASACAAGGAVEVL
jgi:hypothetical protein